MMWDTCTFHLFISSGGSLVIIRTWNPNILSCQPGICRMSGIPADCRSGTRPRHSRTKPEPQCEHCSPLAVILDAAGHRARSRAVLEQTVFCCWGSKAAQVVIPIIVHYHISIARRWTQLSYKNLQIAYIVVRSASCWVLNKHWIICSSLYHTALLKSPKGTKMLIYLSPSPKRVALYLLRTKMCKQRMWNKLFVKNE